MAAAQIREVAVAAALKFFEGKGIKVQTATPITVRDKDTGKGSQKFDVKDVALTAKHVLSAKDRGDKVTITTIDGQRHEAAKSPKDELPGVDDEAADPKAAK